MPQLFMKPMSESRPKLAEVPLSNKTMDIGTMGTGAMRSGTMDNGTVGLCLCAYATDINVDSSI